mmetsp:Transcript_6603/g.18872  ORF Transcript_6603/g.18872 Transcript_6603/m.18872 type:complete len:240 (-) Transcript_6603:365-1084(-)
MGNRHLVQGGVKAAERVVASDVQVLGPNHKGVALALPTDPWGDVKRPASEHGQRNGRVRNHVVRMQCAIQRDHVPELVQATVVSVVRIAVIVPRVGLRVHAEVRHEVMEVTLGPQLPSLLGMRPLQDEPLVVLRCHLGAAVAGGHVRPLVRREDAEVGAPARGEGAIDVSERLGRERRVGDVGKLVRGVRVARVVLQGGADELLHRRDQVRAVPARHSGHRLERRALHLLDARRQLAVH